MSLRREKKAVEDYRAWLIHREQSPATIEKYTRALARFFRESHGKAQDKDRLVPTRETVAAWRDELVARGYAPASVNSLLAGINGYQDFCGNPQGKAKPLKRQRRIFCDAERELEREEYFRLLEAARKLGNKRALLLLQTICSTGIRVSELKAITVQAVRCHKARIQCKGKCREILLPQELCNRLQRWCDRNRIRSGPVFLGRTGKELSRVTVWKIIKALCKQAGVERKKVFPHNLRHLFAKTFYAIEKNLSKLADVLGHSSIETTRIYIMESGTEHERLLNQMKLLL